MFKILNTLSADYRAINSRGKILIENLLTKLIFYTSGGGENKVRQGER